MTNAATNAVLSGITNASGLPAFWDERWSSVHIWQYFVITLCVSVIGSAIVAYLTAVRAIRSERRKQLFDIIKGHICDLKASAAEITQLVDQHLMGSPDGGISQLESQKAILQEFKKAYRCLNLLTEYLPGTHRKDLDHAFLRWKGQLSEAPFPLQNKKKGVLKPHDPRLQENDAATGAFTGQLERTLQQCINGRIVFWKL